VASCQLQALSRLFNYLVSLMQLMNKYRIAEGCANAYGSVCSKVHIVRRSGTNRWTFSFHVVSKDGSAQESVSPCDFGGFCSFGKLVRRRSRCCGNVGTRVLCGFPSSEGNARTLQSGSRFSALGASFPQQALDFVAFRTGCICEPVIRLKCTPFRKPRRMRTSPDSCTEPER
jgi:hypothetical protein